MSQKKLKKGHQKDFIPKKKKKKKRFLEKKTYLH